MKNLQNKHETLVEKHAFARLDKVEQDRQRAYKKKKSEHGFAQIITFIIMALILIVMIISMFQS